MPEPRIAYPLFPRQMEAMESIWLDDVEELFFGGAAGPGKSYFIRAGAFTCAFAWPGARIAVFRDNYTQLAKTQVAKWHAEMAVLGFPVKDHWHATDSEWHFPNPYGADTIVEFLHIDQSIGAEKWLSAEWAALFIDEATQIGATDLNMLYTRVRANSAQRDLWNKLADEREARALDAGLSATEAKKAAARWRPLAVFASNPGSKSHAYFLDEFVIPGRENGLAAWTTSKTIEIDNIEQDVTIKRKFIPAFLTDNPAIDAVKYAASLANLPQQRREQLLGGNWDYFEGKVFDRIYPDTHLVDAAWVFNGKLHPPRDWPRIGGLDHGTTNPTAVEWVTRDEDGFLIAYLEYYAPGNVGLHIDGVRSLMMLDGRSDTLFEADPRMWHKTQGVNRMWSVADEYAYGGEPPESREAAAAARANGIQLHKATIERLAGRIAMQRLLDPQDNLLFPDWHPMRGQHGAPQLFICRQAPNLWRELNGIQFVGEGSEETVKENDHTYDAIYRAAPVFQQRLMQRRTRGPRRILESGPVTQQRRVGVLP